MPFFSKPCQNCFQVVSTIQVMLEPIWPVYNVNVFSFLFQMFPSPKCFLILKNKIRVTFSTCFPVITSPQMTLLLELTGATSPCKFWTHIKSLIYINSPSDVWSEDSFCCRDPPVAINPLPFCIPNGRTICIHKWRERSNHVCPRSILHQLHSGSFCHNFDTILCTTAIIGHLN